MVSICSNSSRSIFETSSDTSIDCVFEMDFSSGFISDNYKTLTLTDESSNTSVLTKQ